MGALRSDEVGKKRWAERFALAFCTALRRFLRGSMVVSIYGRLYLHGNGRHRERR